MKVLVAGDFAPRANLAKQIKEKRFSEVFPENIRKTIKSADFSFVNFESPIVEDCYKPITKCGPNLRCTPEAAEAVKFAGFTGVTMANNHILDYGVEGLRKSVDCCKALGLDIVGVGENLMEAEKILFLEKAGKTLAIINCCEHEYSIATHSKAGANPINPIRQFYTIQEAKKKSDYVIVIVHGGHEMFQLPSTRMVETYRFFIDSGADAVVNHHQHCYSGYEIYNSKPIFYGLGNFAFDWEHRNTGIWTEGYCVTLQFKENGHVMYDLHPYIQYGVKPCVCLLDKNKTSDFLRKVNELSSIIADERKLNKNINLYYTKCSDYEINRLEPYSRAWQNYLFNKGLLPKTMNKSKCMSLLSHIKCESHLDKLVYALEQKSY